MLRANNMKLKIFFYIFQKYVYFSKIYQILSLKIGIETIAKICNIQYAIFKSIANLQYSIVQFLKLLQLQQQYQKPIEYCNFCNIHYFTVSLPFGVKNPDMDGFVHQLQVFENGANQTYSAIVNIAKIAIFNRFLVLLLQLQYF